MILRSVNAVNDLIKAIYNYAMPRIKRGISYEGSIEILALNIYRSWGF